MIETRSTCPYCGVGCGVIVESDGDQITGVRGDPAHPANFGRLCTKGSTLHLTATAPITRQARLLVPQRRGARGGPLATVSWDAALDEAVDRFATIVERDGPDAVGFYLSGQLLTEDYYVFNKLAKGLVGTNNVDTNSRLCMSSAVAGYKQTLGVDAPPCSYEDIDHADTVLIVGSNMAYAHPILFRRLEDAKARKPALRIVVADPRRTETADVADLHVPLLPGTDVAFFHGLLHLMLWEGLVDHAYVGAHTTGFAALRDRVRDMTPKDVARICGIDESALVQTARWFGEAGKNTLSFYCQGLNQSSSGTAKNAALINLHLATGQIGKPGAGPFSLTGQPNAMGGREVGGMATMSSAHRDLDDPAHAAEVAALWNVPSVPTAKGRTAVELFEAMADGTIKAVWIACTNPAQSMPDQAAVRRALERAEFVVVQESFATTATCRYADLLLPATTWGEKDGTVTNSERRISRMRTSVAPAGEARHDWAIATDFGRRLEARLRPGTLTLFPYVDAESVWNEHRETTRGRDLDITGLTYAHLAETPEQWPFPSGAVRGTDRLYVDGRYPTDDGRARFFDTPYRPVAEPRDARFPFALTTGRLRDQWHGMSRTGIGRLFGHVPEPQVSLNTHDMARMKLVDGALVHLTSRRGSIVLPAYASEQVAQSQAFLPMHWGDEYLGGHTGNGAPAAGINALTLPTFCPMSKQPELKHAAVKVLPAELPWRLLAMAWLPPDQALTARHALQALFPRFAFATCVPFGRERDGVLFRAAAAEAVPDELLVEIERLLGLGERQVLHYVDRRRGQRRTVKLTMPVSESRIEAFLLGGDIAAEAWVKPLLVDQLPAQSYGRLLLLPGARPPVAVPSKGRQVCTCFDVGEPAIVATLERLTGEPDARLNSLQKQLKCGTNCGSCIPELKRLVREHAVVAA